jgi:hypothetical protein
VRRRALGAENNSTAARTGRDHTKRIASTVSKFHISPKGLKECGTLGQSFEAEMWYVVDSDPLPVALPGEPWHRASSRELLAENLIKSEEADRAAITRFALQRAPRVMLTTMN